MYTQQLLTMVDNFCEQIIDERLMCLKIESNQLKAMHKDEWIKTFANLFILVMLGASLYLVFKK